VRSFSVSRQFATKIFSISISAVIVKISALFLFQFMLLALPALAQQPGISPGEGFVTRFSGIIAGVDESGREIPVIDPNGVVGSVLDLRRPGQPPNGQHWKNEPQHTPVFASEVGQVYGIAIDDANPPNIFLTATAAFGLHRAPGNTDWMNGMWGPDGGPGTVYRLNAQNGYQPEVFANITLDGRANTGASLGNIAYDAINRQLFVTDLETGMIHRIDAQTGETLGIFDHGLDGRSSFFDTATRRLSSLPLAAFDPLTAARIGDCESAFAQTPNCWNIANYKRRIWGVGVRTDSAGATRLFYGTWGTAAFADADYVPGSEDALNWIWSVGLGPDGSIDVRDVRREFVLPNLNADTPVKPHAPADITFSRSGVMLVGERGSMRNLGLEAASPFAIPAISRVLRYSQGPEGNWLAEGNYYVGNLDVSSDSEPLQLNNSSGGVAFGYGYGPDWTIDQSQPDRFVWMGGDALCSPAGPCFNPATGEFDDTDEVHGIEGTSIDAVNSPEAPQFTGQSYKIDSDLNVNTFGQVLPNEAARNDASKVGDVEIYIAAGGDFGQLYPPGPVHDVQFSAFHRKYESAMHDKRRSLPLHNKVMSRQRPPHNKIQSGWRPPHNKALSRIPPPPPPPIHYKVLSRRVPPPLHNKVLSRRIPPPIHNKVLSRRVPPPIHDKVLSRRVPPPLHNKVLSRRVPPPLHNKVLSRRVPPPLHNKLKSGLIVVPPHNKIKSGLIIRPPHNKIKSRIVVVPPHNKIKSGVIVRPPHNKIKSRLIIRPPVIVRPPKGPILRNPVIVRPPHNKIKSRVTIRPPVVVRPPKGPVLRNPVIVRPPHNKIKSRVTIRPSVVVRPPKGPVLRNPVIVPRVKKPQIIMPPQNNLIIQPPLIKQP